MAFHRLVQQAVATGQLDVVESSSGLRTRAFELMGRFGDLRLSYADAVGGAVAHQLPSRDSTGTSTTHSAGRHVPRGLRTNILL